jgi:hypothetical protein
LSIGRHRGSDAMRIAVHLYDKPCALADKIRNVGAKTLLPAKLEAAEGAAA